MPQEYKYFAFISYNQRDIKWGKRLQRKLENYKMPSTLCSERGWSRKPLKPIFFAPTDIQPNDLNDELKERLRASRYLIVICSPHSAQSEWVGKEIAYFHSLGRKENIHLFIVDGVPNSGNPDTECFNPVLRELGLDGVLGANVNEKIYGWSYMNRQRAYVQLITKLLGVEFDTIWQRHKRQLVEKWTMNVCLAVAVIVAMVVVWQSYRTVDVCIKLYDPLPKNNNLPQIEDAEVVLRIGNDERRQRVKSIDDNIVFEDIPNKLLGSNVEIRFVDFPDTPGGANYFPDTIHRTLCPNMSITIKRDTIKYGHLRARMVDSNYNPLPFQETTVVGINIKADDKGYIDTHIPYAQQSKTYVIEGDTISDIGWTSSYAIVVE